MESFVQDLRFALRSMRSARGATALAAICLALGIGANTAIYSVVHAVLLQSLPYSKAERLVNINEVGSHGVGQVSGAMYLDLAAQHAIFDDVAAFNQTNRDLGDVADPERLRGARVTTNLFTTLGARAIRGRVLQASDTPPAAAPVVIISERLWRRRFGGDERLVGATITLSGTKYTVAGIMPAEFDFPIASVAQNEFWVPIDLAMNGGTTNRNNHGLDVVARLKAGVDSARAAVGLAALARQLEIAYPATNKGRTLLVRGVMGRIVGSVRPALLNLFAAAGLVLLIACANVGNLALVRGIARRREIAIRTALGAERLRVVRQLITENALLGAVGGALGLALSWFTLRVLMGSTAGILPRREGIGLDFGALAFAMGLSILTGIVVGLLPALGVSRRSLHSDLSDGAARTSASGARRRLLETFVGVEIVLSVLLLAGAGLAIRSFSALLSVDPGFATEGILTFAINAPPRAMDDTSLNARFYLPIRDRLARIPGVRGAAMISTLPVAGGTTDRFFQIVGKPADTDPMTRPDGEIRVISDGYFRAMGIPIVAGREFTEADVPTSPRVAIINNELAKRFFAGEDPIGQSIEIRTGEPRRIVGVVRSVREVGLDQPARAEFYLPVTQSRENDAAMSFVLATARAPETVVGDVRDAVQSLAPRQPIYQLATMRSVVHASLGRQRLLYSLLGAFAILALLLAAAGVFGVMSYGVAQRRREIGIRIALGARLADVTGMVLGDAVRVIGVAIVVGLGAAFLATRAMASVLYGVSTHDVVTFVAAPLVIGIVALIAGAVPALRAGRTDPLVAMRPSD